MNVKFPDVVGVPDKVPPEDSVRFVGRVPLVTVKVYAPAPPLAITDRLYAVPIIPPGSVDVRVIVPQITSV